MCTAGCAGLHSLYARVTVTFIHAFPYAELRTAMAKAAGQWPDWVRSNHPRPSEVPAAGRYSQPTQPA